MEADELIELMRQPFSSCLNIMALLDANCDFPATTGRDVIIALVVVILKDVFAIFLHFLNSARWWE